MLQGVSIYLIGMMGSGKSTVGHKLAKRLNYRFIDLDNLIEKISKQSIKDIFNQQGEAFFRDLESQVLAETSAYTRTVVATGGGIVLRRDNWSYLRHGLIIWLDAPIEILISRLSHDKNRPLLQVEDPVQVLAEILEKRLLLYQQADLTIHQNQGQSADQLAQEIITKIPNVLKPQLNGPPPPEELN